MSSKRRSCLIVDQLLCISVVGTDEHHAVHFFDCLYGSSDTFVNRFHRFDRCRFHTGMPDHIRVRKVNDDHVIFAGLDRIYQIIAHFIRTHLRFQVIGRNIFGRIDQNPVLSLVRLFHTAVKEESNMRIFFRLRDPRLLHMMSGKPFSKRIRNGNLMECHLLIRNRRVIIGKADIRHIQPFSSVKALEIIVAEASRDLSCPVRTEVKENNGIAVFDRRNGCAVLHDNSRLYKFIRFLSVIRSLNPFRCARSLKPFALCQRNICLLHPVIIVISVHRIITARHGSYLADADLLHFRL